MVATPANTASTRTCSGCGGVQRIYIRQLPPRSSRDKRLLVMGLMEIRGTLVRFWRCETDTCIVSEDAGTKWVELPEPEPVRQHIVFRLKALREKGWRFFEWQKQ